MKPFTKRRAYIASLVFSPLFLLGRTAGRNRIFPALLVITILFTGCFQHYFRTNTQTSADATILNRLQNSNKYFVVHFTDNKVFGLNNVSVNNDKLEGNLVVLPDEHNKYLEPVNDEANRVAKRDKATALLEVHLYTNNSLGNTNELALPLSSFNRIDVYTFDEKRTRSGVIFSAIGIAATVGYLVVGIAIAGAGVGF